LLTNPTRLVDFRGLNFIEDKSLEGKKYGVMVEGSKDIRVSPAVFELVQDDPETLAKVLVVQIIPKPTKRSQRRPRGG
jgi:hypothetical protein